MHDLSQTQNQYYSIIEASAGIPAMEEELHKVEETGDAQRITDCEIRILSAKLRLAKEHSGYDEYLLEHNPEIALLCIDDNE